MTKLLLSVWRCLLLTATTDHHHPELHLFVKGVVCAYIELEDDLDSEGTVLNANFR
jgi:hypothetical protein